MSESDFGKKTAAAETGRHHDKQHRTSFGKTTSRRSSNQRTRAAHHSKHRHQKGTTFMKKKASATALALFIVTLLFVTGSSTKAATFSTNGTFGPTVTFTSPSSALVTKDWKTLFTQTATVYTRNEGTFAPSTNGQYTNSITLCTAKTQTNQRWFTTDRFRSGTVKTSASNTVSGGQTGRFTIQQGNDPRFIINETTEFFDETNQGFNQFFF
jgi:hypothetical protein